MYNWITLLCTWNFVRQLYINNICIYVYLLLLYIYFLYINIKKKKIKCIDHIWATVSTSCESQKENLEVLMLLKLLRTYKLMCMPREWRLASGRSKNRSWKGIHQGSPVHFKAPRIEERLLFMTGLITPSKCIYLNVYPLHPPGDGIWELWPLVGDTVKIINLALYRTYAL